MFEKYGIKKFLYTNGKLNFAETRVSNALTYSISYLYIELRISRIVKHFKFLKGSKDMIHKI